MSDRKLVAAFLKETEALILERYAEQLFDDEVCINTANDTSLVDQTTLPMAPGSEDMAPVAMHMEALSPGITGTEGTPLVPIEEVNDEDLALFEEDDLTDDDLDEFTRLRDRMLERRRAREGFQYEEANQEQLGQPMQNQQTQPPAGVTNMTGGSEGSQGSTPGTQSPQEGGTTGTVPATAPMNQGYGAPQTPQGVQTVNQEELDILPEDDEMLLSEF